MHNVAVLEPAPGKLTPLIRDTFLARGAAPSVFLTRGDRPEAFCGIYDLFIAAKGGGVTGHAGTSCRALLMPGDEPPLVPSKWVVSYGFAPRDTLTLSSLTEKQAVFALQRELVTLEGVVIEQQERPITIPPGWDAPSVMALYGSLLLLGILPEELEKFGGNV